MSLLECLVLFICDNVSQRLLNVFLWNIFGLKKDLNAILQLPKDPICQLILPFLKTPFFSSSVELLLLFKMSFPFQNLEEFLNLNEISLIDGLL